MSIILGKKEDYENKLTARNNDDNDSKSIELVTVETIPINNDILSEKETENVTTKNHHRDEYVE